jgi:hypothetical protein
MAKQFMAKQQYRWSAISALGLLASVAIAPKAIAQDDMFMNFFMDAGQFTSDYIGDVVVGESIIQYYGEGATEEATTDPYSAQSDSYSEGFPDPTGQSTSDFTFQPSAELSQQLRSQFIAKYASSDTSDSLPFRQLLETQNWVNDFASDFYGLSSHDVADAMTGYWVRSWMLINDQPAPSLAQIEGINRQIRTGMSDIPIFSQGSDAQRQEMAEYLIYQQSLTYGTYLAAVSAGDTETKKQIQDMVNTSMIELGLNFREIEITDSGFQSR